ncbi:hypothetical protein PLESTM_001124600 [Pleodorina starrii]|nr:hypothetical protein PLESTM_001124600 [Pleodorina starrii]
MTTTEISPCHEQATKRIKTSCALEQYAEEVGDALVNLWQGSASTGQLQLLDEKVIWHDSLIPQHNALVGREKAQALADLLRGAFPDLSLAFRRPLHPGQEGVVLGYWRAAGTHTGALGPSLPPSGAKASWEGSLVIRTRSKAAAEAAGAVEAAAAAGPELAGVSEGRSEAAAAAATASAAAAGGSGPLRGVEVWWSWDPIFLFRQLGWKEQLPVTTEAPEGPAAAAAAAAASEASAGVADGGAAAGGEADLATRTAAAARAAFATEAAAAEAAAAAVAAAAAAAERVADSPESLAAAQAANRRVVEMYFHTYNTGNYEVLDHIVHPDYQYDGLLDLGGKRGRAAMAAMMGGWRDCLPDLAIGHELFVAVGADKVTFRWVIRGTHSAPRSKLLGVPASGSRLHVCGVTTLTLRGGRIVRKVSHANAAHTLQQLGAAVHPVIEM